MSTEEERTERAKLAFERLAKYRQDPYTEEIDGIHYTSSKFPAMQQIALLSRVGRVLGGDGLRMIVLGSGSLKQVFASAQGNAQLLDSMSVVLSNIGHDLKLLTDVLAYTKCSALRPGGEGGDITPKSFEGHFRGEIPHMVGVLHFVLSHNFAGFTLGSPSTSGSRT